MAEAKAAAASGCTEFFATGLHPIENTPEFVRLIFYSDTGSFAVVLTPSAYETMAGKLMIGADRRVN